MQNKRKRLDDAIASVESSKIRRIERILDPTQQRFTVFPIKENEIWRLYKNQQALFWKAEEIDFSGDRRDFETLDPDTQHFIKMTLAFFAASDGIVNFNLGERFTREIQIMEAQICYNFQKMMEDVHGECYSIMLDQIIRDPKEKERLFNAVKTVPVIKKMADWALKWVGSDSSFAHRLVAFSFVEGVFFSGAFASIFWLKKYLGRGKNFLNGLIKSNEFISRDEGMHTDFADLLYSYLDVKLSQLEIGEMALDVEKIVVEFTNELLRVDLIGINKIKMAEYIRYVIDMRLVSLGHQKIFNAKNPFDFIATIGLFGKTNFFESRPTEYQDASILNKSKNSSFKLLSDF